MPLQVKNEDLAAGSLPSHVVGLSHCLSSACSEVEGVRSKATWRLDVEMERESNVRSQSQSSHHLNGDWTYHDWCSIWHWSLLQLLQWCQCDGFDVV